MLSPYLTVEAASEGVGSPQAGWGRASLGARDVRLVGMAFWALGRLAPTLSSCRKNAVGGREGKQRA